MKSLGILPFNELRPDEPDFNNAGIEVARNCIARTTGYSPLPSVEVGALEPTLARPQASHASVDQNETPHFYIAAEDKILQQSGANWTTAGGPYTVPKRWEMLLFTQSGNAVQNAGDDLVIALPAEDASGPSQLSTDPQFVIRGGSTFADLTTLVRGSTMAMIRNHLVLGNTFDVTDGEQENRVRWSAQGDCRDFVPDQVTLSDFRNLSGDGGRIRRILGYEFGIVFQERAIQRMTYIGSPGVFQFDLVEPGIGIFGANTAVFHGGRAYFLSTDGFRVTTGDRSVPIGEDRVDREVLSDLDATYLDRITAGILSQEQVIIWAYPGAGNVEGRPNKIAIYNYEINKWTLGEEAIQLISEGPTQGFQPLDNPIGNNQSWFDDTYGNLDAVPGSFDDAQYAGSGIADVIFNDSAQLATWTGPPRTATIESQELQPIEGRRLVVQGARPIIDGGSVEMALGWRNDQGQTVTYTSDRGPRSSGYVPFRKNARYHRFRATVSGDWKTAYGVEPFGGIGGAR